MVCLFVGCRFCFVSAVHVDVFVYCGVYCVMLSGLCYLKKFLCVIASVIMCLCVVCALLCDVV